MATSKFVHVNGLKMLRVPVGEITIDAEYQRRLDEKRALKIGKAWDPALGGIIVVSLRADRKLYAIDGQHRVAGLKLAGKADMVLAVDVREGLTQKDEADLFVKLNSGRSPVRVYDAFKARIIAEEPEAVAINGIVKAAGLHLATSASKNAIAAVGAMQKVHRRYETLAPTLSVLRSWSCARAHDPVAYDKRIVSYVGRFLFEFASASPDVLGAKLIKFGRPEYLIARITREQTGYRQADDEETATMTLLDIYNTRNRNKLVREDRARKPKSEKRLSFAA